MIWKREWLSWDQAKRDDTRMFRYSAVDKNDDWTTFLTMFSNEKSLSNITPWFLAAGLTFVDKMLIRRMKKERFQICFQLSQGGDLFLCLPEANREGKGWEIDIFICEGTKKNHCHIAGFGSWQNVEQAVDRPRQKTLIYSQTSLVLLYTSALRAPNVISIFHVSSL